MAVSQEEIRTVEQLTREIKRYIDQNEVWRDVWVRGELSNFNHHNRGHMYFTLKDESSRIRAVMFQRFNRWLKFKPIDGQKVLVRGEVSVYERDGQYQFYVKEMQPDGVGSLFQAYEELKERLRQKGWFSPELKKPIPSIPQKIGVITSPTGAAVQDVITTLKRRFPIARVVIIPALVQGREAAESIARAIRLAHRYPFDLLIVGRGGGSIEELWAFNEEEVARAIYEAEIPIISAVGHETDYTIADLVADLRAPTPTAAAELAVPVLTDLIQHVNQAQERLHERLISLINTQRQRVDSLRNRYAFRYPHTLLRQKEEQLDQCLERFTNRMERFLTDRNHRLDALEHRLKQTTPARSLERVRQDHQRLNASLIKAMDRIISAKRESLKRTIIQVDALSPLKIMSRGYALVYAEGRERLYKSVAQIEPGEAIHVQMHDGVLDCQVWGIKEENDK